LQRSDRGSSPFAERWFYRGYPWLEQATGDSGADTLGFRFA
jgi:hypothetical protein